MPSLFNLTYYDPPPRLARCILSLFHFSWDERKISDRHPGALAQLVLFPYGSGEITFGDRTDPVDGDAYLLAGFETASPFTMNGPWHAIGASLSPQGWAALTGRPVSDYVSRFIPASELLGEDINVFAAQLNEAYRNGSISGEDACYELASWIEKRLGDVPEEHEDLMEATFAWLSTSLGPDVEELFAGLSYSRRQAERLVTRYFGLSPMALARKYRAV